MAESASVQGSAVAPKQQQAAPAAAPSKPATGPLSDAEQSQLASLQARQQAAAAGESVRMKVEGDHASLSYGGVTVTTDPTPVPVSMVAALVEAAADAGVTITQES